MTHLQLTVILLCFLRPALVWKPSEHVSLDPVTKNAGSFGGVCQVHVHVQRKEHQPTVILGPKQTKPFGLPPWRAEHKHEIKHPGCQTCTPTIFGNLPAIDLGTSCAPSTMDKVGAAVQYFFSKTSSVLVRCFS